MANTNSLERAFIRCLSTDAEVCGSFIDRVDEEFFTTDAHKLFFEIIRKQFVENHSLVSDRLIGYEIERLVPDEFKEKFRQEWGFLRFEEEESSPEALFRSLEDAKTARQALGVFQELVKGIEEGADIDGLVGKAKADLIGIGTDRKRSELRDIHEYQDIIDEINDKQLHPEKYRGIHSGFKSYDRKTGGFHNAEFIVFSALSSVGKSTMLKALAFNLAYYQKKNVLFISDEETNSEVRLKFASLATGINAFNIREGKVSAQEKKVICDALSSMTPPTRGQLWTVEIPERSTSSVISQLYHEAEQKGFKADVIVIDYLDRLAPTVRSYDQYDEQGKMVMDVKGLARALEVVIITATQSNASAEDKQKKGQHMNKTETHGSKKVLHEADALIFINLQGYAINQLKSAGGDRETERECDRFWRIEVAKHRTAQTFDFYCQHHVRTGKITEVSQDEFDQQCAPIDDGGLITTTTKKEPVLDHSDSETKKQEAEKDKEAIVRFNAQLKRISQEQKAKYGQHT